MIIRGDTLYLVCWADTNKIAAGFSSLHRARWYQCYKGARHRKLFKIRTCRVDTQIIPKATFEWCYNYYIINGVIKYKYITFDEYKRNWLEVGKSPDGVIEYRAKIYMKQEDDELALSIAQALTNERNSRTGSRYRGRHI